MQNQYSILQILNSKPDVNKIVVTIYIIELTGFSEGFKAVKLELGFDFFNNNEQAVTASKIDYSLNANEIPLGNYFVLYEELPLDGRRQIIPDRDTE